MSTKPVRNTIIITVLLAASLLLSGCNQGGSALGASAVESKVITVVGQGEARGVPDQARVNVGVDVLDQDVAQAVAKNETTVDAILKSLAGLGIAKEDIQTSNYSLYAEQKYGDQGAEGISGYRVSNQVSVTIREIERVSEVLKAVIGAGANSIYGVEFILSDPAALESQARADALSDAQKRASELAQISGVELGGILSISEVITPVFPVLRYGMGGGAESVAAAAPSIAPGQVSVSAQVQVTYELK